MRCLFLDLASHDALIACVDDQQTISFASASARIGDHELLPMIEHVLKDAGWKYEDLDRIACVVGPGGFTSLRIAVTCVNVLSDQLDVPSTGIHLSDLYYARFENERGKRKEEKAFWLHSTKKDQLFIRGGEWSEPTLIATSEFQSRVASHESLLWSGELIDEHRALINLDPIELKLVTDVLPRFLSDQEYSKEILTPWYGRGW